MSSVLSLVTNHAHGNNNDNCWGHKLSFRKLRFVIHVQSKCMQSLSIENVGLSSVCSQGFSVLSRDSVCIVQGYFLCVVHDYFLCVVHDYT